MEPSAVYGTLQSPGPASEPKPHVVTFPEVLSTMERDDIALRFRGDRIRVDEDFSGPPPKDEMEIRVWRLIEGTFCFLKDISLYEVRRYIRFIIVWQAIFCTVRFIPILLGYSYLSTIPVFVLMITLVFGWHGSNHLVAKYLLFYKIGMQLSICIDIFWYAMDWNGSFGRPSKSKNGPISVPKATAFWIQIIISISLFCLNFFGLLYGWKLRRIVKSVQHKRECEQAAFVAAGPPPSRRLTEVLTPDSPIELTPTDKRKVIAGKEHRDDHPCPNSILTSKYTLYNFVYVFFKMQFSRLANVYTCIVVALCFFSFSPVDPASSLLPLLIVFATAAVKDVSEDLRRQKADKAVNSKPTNVLVDGTVVSIPWMDVRVGDILVLYENDDIPSDCLLLGTSAPNGLCYVQTANLDGETNLKIRQTISQEYNLENLSGTPITIDCDLPSKNMFEWSAYVQIGSESFAASMDNLILRGSEMRTAGWTVGIVVYTGAETKSALNAASPDSKIKRTLVERTLDTMFVVILVMLFSISLACTLGNNNWSFRVTQKNKVPWYLAPAEADYIFLSYVILFNNLISLSMYVTMEGVRFVHARYIENDVTMYDEATDTPAAVRNSNINEDLGQVKYIFSDKTGTLTRNEMVFAKCSIAGLKYNDNPSEEDDPAPRPGTRFNDPRLLARYDANHASKKDIHEFLVLLMICNTAIPQAQDDGGILYQSSSPDEQALCAAARDLEFSLERRSGSMCYTSIRGESVTFEILHVLEFTSDRKRMSVIVKSSDDSSIRLYCKGADDVILERLCATQVQGVVHVTRGHLQEYAAQGLRTLTTAMRILSPDVYEEWKTQYEAAEKAMDKERMDQAADEIERDLSLLGATAIEDLLQEGAEDCIYSLRKAGINFWVLTGDKKETAISIGMSSQVIDDTMDVIVLDKKDKMSLTATLEELYVHLVEEQKWDTKKDDSMSHVLLQTLRRVFGTAYSNIMSAISGKYDNKKNLKRRKTRLRLSADNAANLNWEVYPAQHSTRSNNSENSGLDDDDPYLEEVDLEIEGLDEENVEYAMVIDGRTLAMVLENDIKYLFLAVAQQCKSVICCRCSPAQKAAVVRLVTERTLLWTPGNITLAIGDGANDVPMIQAASVGVGIGGKEGRQAVLSSDYSIAQFRFLKRLLLVHGNYSYKRISKLILFSFMKNIALSLSSFFYAPAAKYSGILPYPGISFTMYNALFTTVPIVFIAMYNQDVNPSVLMQYPTLYRNGLEGRSFNWTSFFGWCCLGLWHAYLVYVTPFCSDGNSRNYFSGEDSGVLLYNSNPLGLASDGVAGYSYLIMASMFQVALLTSNWTLVNCIAVIGTSIFYFLFMWFFAAAYELTGYDFLETYEYSNAFQMLAQEPWFWLGMGFCSIAAVLPNYILKAGRVLFYPEPSHLMREWNKIPLDLQQVPPPPIFRPGPISHPRNQSGFAFSTEESHDNI
ncbi:P-type ATPase (P-ATPase) Superfamily [Thraustotheca clavata]|uniref:Phospholipid-transporting ATPase n=1 Tax=Thraustotheca clavata TaxID=74557 RepID=A0A1W0A132_9STRA|nr:P-type ATPase (P-ATPase) Superfamily [Thraustotheca clavata]